MQSLPSISIKTAPQEEIKAADLNPYCEHPALSLSTPGVTCRALSAPKESPVLSETDKQRMLDALCCFYNLETCKSGKSGTDLRAAWDAAVANQPEHRKIYWAHLAK